MPRATAKFMKGEREIAAETLILPLKIVGVEGDWLDVGPARVKKSEVVLLENAAEYYSAYLLLHPRSSWGYHHRGIAWHETGQLDKAIKDYTEAIRLDPEDASSYNTRGAAHFDKSELDAALKDFDDAIRLDPNVGFVYRNRGMARQTKGDLVGALLDYANAVRLDPADQISYNGRAWILATSADGRYRNPAQAVADATKACELSAWKDDASLDTLAAAYAAAGDFEQAIKWQEKALSLAGDADRADFASRLKLYRDGKAFRQ
jgi:tetratricopeptide (TPR) repeat protein